MTSSSNLPSAQALAARLAKSTIPPSVTKKAGSLNAPITLRRLLPVSERLSHIVVMGMGEPLHNYDAVLAALEGLQFPCLANFDVCPEYLIAE